MRSPGGLLAVLAVLAVMAFAVSTACAATLAPHSESALLAAMNRAREAHGLRPLRLDGRLRIAARAHCREMMRYDYFGHGSFGRRLSSFRVHGPVVGENLAWGNGLYRRAGVIVAEWLHSPEHRANLLRPGFSRVGVGSLTGRFVGYRDVLVVTADFAGQ
jgi:uncharacterized protein YkwD